MVDLVDADDYCELYRQYLPRILNYIRLRVDGQDLAQDLTAEVFERAVTRQHTLRDRAAFGAWIFRIARNVVAGHYRQTRRGGGRTSLALEQAAEQAAPDPQPVDVMLHQEELARLTAAMAALSKREQEIIRLKFAAGLGNREIGEILSLRPGHVAVILFRALAKMRARLEGS